MAQIVRSGTFDELPAALADDAFVVTGPPDKRGLYISEATEPWGPGVAFSGCRVYSSLDLVIPTGLDTPLIFNSERWDVGGYHDPAVNPTRITAPFTGYFHLGGGIVYETNTVGRRYLTLLVNGVTKVGNKALPHPLDAGSVDHRMVDAVTTDWFMNAGDYFEVVAFQDSGGNLNAPATPAQGPEAWIHLIGR